MKRLFTRSTIALLFLIGLSQLAAAQSADDLLEPDKAFTLSTRVLDANTLEASWKIADGYYMYRDKFRFEVIAGQTRLADPIFPAGKIKIDASFGEPQELETYSKQVSIRIPIARSETAAHEARLRITAQGCNEPVGVCYAPITKEIVFSLPAASTAAPNASQVPTSLKALNQFLGGGSEEQEFLPPDEAFKLYITAQDRGLKAQFVIAEGYYLYRHKTKFSIDAKGGTQLGKYSLPKGKAKHDESYGDTEVYYQGLELELPLVLGPGTRTVQLNAQYQGCADGGICYTPISKTIAVDVTAQAGGESNNNGLVLAMLTAFVVGLGLTFTGCVLPMIPILMSIIVGESDKPVSRLRGGSLAGFYVLGTSVTWTAVGVAAGLAGIQLQAYFQNIWAIGFFSLILVLMALAMFDLYTIQMPAAVQSRLQSKAQNIKGGKFIGVFALGLISALIVGACVSPILGVMLAGAMATQDPLLGGAVMFSAAWGMGVLLIAMGVGAGFLIPKAGTWMNRVKHVFGVILIGVAIYLLGFLPQVPVLYLWAALLIITSIYFGAVEPVPAGAGGWRYFFKGVGMLMLVWGVLALVGGFAGNRDILRPIPLSFYDSLTTTSKHADTSTTTQTHLFERIATLEQLEQKLSAAKHVGKPVLLDYFATWCTDCLRMEKSTFADAQVHTLVEQRFVALQVDVTDPNDAQSKAIKQRFNVFGPPAMLFFDAAGNLRKELNFYGYKNTRQFLQILNQI